MEKRVPHYPLEEVQTLVRAGAVRPTRSALGTAAALGIDFAEIIVTLQALQRSDFYKSMTSYRDHQEWQDVYRPAHRAGDLYIKLTVRGSVVVLSFKER